MDWQNYPDLYSYPHLNQDHARTDECVVSATADVTEYGVFVFFQCETCKQFWSQFHAPHSISV